MVSARAAELKHDQPESLMKEVMSLTSMDDSFVKLTRVGGPNKLCLQEMGKENESV